MDDKYKDYNNLLKDLNNISIEMSPSNKTLMQVTGYPHFENVCSNILAFFFSTNEDHGLNDLFFHSLMELVFNCINKRYY